jgi:hypothetical protein
MNRDATNLTANSRAMEFWEQVVGDMEATANEYADQDWHTLMLHPGDVTPIARTEGDDEDENGEDDVTEYGLDVLVPDNEFEDLESLLDDGVEFDSFEAFRAMEEGMVYVVVAMEDHDAETAVLYPAYYDVQGAEPMLDAAAESGTMYTFVRTLSEDRIRFTHDDASAFQPPEPVAEEETGAQNEGHDGNESGDEDEESGTSGAGESADEDAGE